MADGCWRRFAVAWCLQWQERWNSWWSSIDQNSDQHGKNATNFHSPPLIMWHWSHNGRKDPRAVSQTSKPSEMIEELLRSLNNHPDVGRFLLVSPSCSVSNRATWIKLTVCRLPHLPLPRDEQTLKVWTHICQNFSHYYISVHEGSNLVLSNYGTVSLTRQANLMPDALNMARQV